MAFNPKKVDFSNINGGREYTETDIVTPSDFNDVFKSAHYTQKAMELFGSELDTTEIALVGVPKAEIVYRTINGVQYPYLKISNLKGEKGDAGIGNATLSNEKGESTDNGYTQYAINKMISKPNLLINPNFRINQRGQNTYQVTGTTTIYTVDRWKLDGNGTVSVDNNGVRIKSNGGTVILYQIIENSNVLINQDACISVCVNNKIVSKPTGRITTDTNYTLTVDNGCQVVFNYTGEEFNLVFVISDTIERTINWAKLEIGGAYSLFSPPIYAEELLKCQRYYQELHIDTSAVATSSTAILQLTVPLVTTMRKTVTVMEKETTFVLSANGVMQISIATLNKVYDNSIRLTITPRTGEVAFGTPYKVSAYLTVDGEL